MKKNFLVSLLRCLALLMSLNLLAMASCSQVVPPDSKKEAKARWDGVRAKLKYQMAMDAFNANRLEDAEKHLKEAIALCPAHGASHVLQAKVLLERGETGSAAEALDIALKNGADIPEMDYLSGVISQRYGRFDNALAWYQRAASRQPMHAPYWVAVAETLVALERPADALALVREHWTDFEQNATLRAVAGNIYMMLGQYEDAANAYRDAARIAPDDARLQAQLGTALALANHYEEAIAALSNAVQLTERNAEPLDASILAALGRCQIELSQPEEAKSVLRKAVQSDPNKASHWVLLARASLKCNDLISAREAADHAVQLQPQNIENMMLLAYVASSQRDFPAAISHLERVLREDASDLIALYLLAQCHERAGNLPAARQTAERALRVNPQCEWAGTISKFGTVSADPDLQLFGTVKPVAVSPEGSVRAP